MHQHEHSLKVQQVEIKLKNTVEYRIFFSAVRYVTMTTKEAKK